MGKIRALRTQLSRDIIQLIVSFFPSMYGGHYDVHKHNRDLANQLEQKTSHFRVADIRCCLHCGSRDDDQSDAAENGYVLGMDFSESKADTLIVRVSLRCKVSRQGITLLRPLDTLGGPLQQVPLPALDP